MKLGGAAGSRRKIRAAAHDQVLSQYCRFAFQEVGLGSREYEHRREERVVRRIFTEHDRAHLLQGDGRDRVVVAQQGVDRPRKTVAAVRGDRDVPFPVARNKVNLLLLDAVHHQEAGRDLLFAECLTEGSRL